MHSQSGWRIGEAEQSAVGWIVQGLAISAFVARRRKMFSNSIRCSSSSAPQTYCWYRLAMAFADTGLIFIRALRQNLLRTHTACHVRHSSTAAAPAPHNDLPQSSFDTPGPSEEQVALFNPVETASKRPQQLPGSK
jgi:hypothetical protein